MYLSFIAMRRPHQTFSSDKLDRIHIYVWLAHTHYILILCVTANQKAHTVVSRFMESIIDCTRLVHFVCICATRSSFGTLCDSKMYMLSLNDPSKPVRCAPYARGILYSVLVLKGTCTEWKRSRTTSNYEQPWPQVMISNCVFFCNRTDHVVLFLAYFWLD